MDEPDAFDTAPSSVLRLLSTPGVNTAGLLAWARNGYVSELTRGGPVAPFIAVFAEGYGLGAVVAERVLRGETSAVIDGEEVELRLNGEETHLVRTCGQVGRAGLKAVVQA